MNRKIIIIIALLIMLSLAAGITLWVRQDEEPSANQEPTTALNEFSATKVISAVSSYDKSAIWYFDQSARLFRANPESKEVSEFSLPVIPGSVSLLDVAWPDAGNDFLASTTGSSEKSIHYYDNEKQEYKSWPKNIQSFDWMPDGRRVLYIWKSGDNTTQQLVMANADTSGFRIIADVFWPDLKVQVSPNGLEALLVRTKPEREINKIYKADLNSGEFETIVADGKNLDVRWLPGGDRFIYTRISQNGSPMMVLYDFNTGLQNDMRIEGSLDKVFVDDAGSFAYVAVAKQDGVGDKFVKIDLNTFQKEDYYNPEEALTAKNLFFANGDLYFINTLDRKLYFIDK
jgi:hypothetical protein